jgi:hypothetical protein
MNIARALQGLHNARNHGFIAEGQQRLQAAHALRHSRSQNNSGHITHRPRC